MMKKIIRFVLGTLLLALGPLAQAQQTGRMHRFPG
jgi:hypothetical protein